MSENSAPPSSSADKAKKKMQLQKKFGSRITIARQAREAFQLKDYVNAVKKYNEYLGLLAEINDAEDIFKIEPKMFDQQKDVTELLLISHVYWELAKIYEMMPKLQVSFAKTLNQFVRFTINQPFQVVNAEMLRRHIKKNKKTTPYINELNIAYSKIYVESKKCYVATNVYGSEHWVTNTLRDFKNMLVQSNFGIELTRLYYISSPLLIRWSEKNYFYRLCSSAIFKPLLMFIAIAFRILCLSFQKLVPKNGLSR